MTCMDLRETQRTAVLLEKQAGTLRTLSAELEEISRTIKRKETLLQASTSVEKEAGTLAELSYIAGQMGRALEMAAVYEQQAEKRVTEQYEGSGRNYTAPETVLVDCAAWEHLPDDILIY